LRNYVLALAVLAAAGLPSLAMAGATQGNATVAASPAQMNDKEMDNVTAGGNAFGKPTAPGQIKKLSGDTKVQGWGRLYAPGQIKKGL
jgi:hypothetical protein